jgi:hypothetical protein
MNEIVVYPRKFKMFLFAAGALWLFCSSLVFAIWPDEIGVSWRVVIASWLGIPFFGLGFTYICYRLIVPKPSVILNHKGIFDNSSAFSAGLIEWNEIASFYIFEVRGHRLIGIVPLDVDAFLQRQTAFKRRLLKIKSGPPIAIPQIAISMKIDELLLKIHDYHQHHAGLKGRT